MPMNLKAFALAALAAVLLAPAGAKAEPREAVVYKDPNCGCCAEYAKYLEGNGFAVSVVDTRDLTAVKHAHDVPEALAGCHTVLVEGYVVEGHVPVSVLERLLSERPEIKGISLPGMPAGSPGMEPAGAEPYTVFLLRRDGSTAPLERVTP